MSHQLEKRIVKRYSQAFKQKVICEIGGCGTIENWIKQLGKNQLLAQRVRIETTEEVNQLKELESDKQQLESALTQGLRCLHYLSRYS